MEQLGPAKDPQMMEESEVKLEESHSVDQLRNSTSCVEEEEQISQSNSHQAEISSQTEEELQLNSEFIRNTTYVEEDKNSEEEAQICTWEHVEGRELAAETGCDAITVSLCSERPPLCLSNDAAAILANSVTPQVVVEGSPSVLEGTVETSLTFDAANPNGNVQPSILVTSCSSEPSHVDSSDSPDSLSSSFQSTPKNSPVDSSTTSGISNGPSTLNSDTVSSSPASSPQTSANDPVPSHPSSSPFDTDCSRKLISQIQRSLSQESLLDELESELLSCQLPDRERKGSSPINGLPTDQEGCMVVFEKCVQYKYSQQEKAIQR